jgi:hypothetical protein
VYRAPRASHERAKALGGLPAAVVVALVAGDHATKVGPTVGQVSFAVHLETEAGVVTNQLRSARIEERRAPRSARETQTMLNQRRADAAALRVGFRIGGPRLCAAASGRRIDAMTNTPSCACELHGAGQFGTTKEHQP